MAMGQQCGDGWGEACDVTSAGDADRVGAGMWLGHSV